MLYELRGKRMEGNDDLFRAFSLSLRGRTSVIFTLYHKDHARDSARSTKGVGLREGESFGRGGFHQAAYRTAPPPSSRIVFKGRRGGSLGLGFLSASPLFRRYLKM